RPIGGQHDAQVWILNLHFTQSGAAGNVIPAMAVEQEDSVKSHPGERTAEAFDDGHVACDVQAHATEMSVMRRVTNRPGAACADAAGWSLAASLSFRLREPGHRKLHGRHQRPLPFVRRDGNSQSLS